MKYLAFLLGTLLCWSAQAQQVPHPVGGPSATTMDYLPCWNTASGNLLKECSTIKSAVRADVTVNGLVSDKYGGFGGYAQNLFTVKGDGHTTTGVPGWPGYNTPIIAVEGDANSNIGGATSGTTHVGVVGWAALTTTPYTYTSGKQEYWQGGYFNGGATVACGGTLPANPCGTVWGSASHAALYPAAVGFNGAIGTEIDVQMFTGSSANARIGALIVDVGEKQGNAYDAAIVIGRAPAAPGFRNGIDFNAFTGAVGLATTGAALINATSAFTVDTLFNLGNVTCTTHGILLQSGWEVDCGGRINTPSDIYYTNAVGAPLKLFNFRDASMELQIDSGNAAAQAAGVTFSDRSTKFFALYKDSTNNFRLDMGTGLRNVLVVTGGGGTGTALDRMGFGVPVGFKLTTVATLPTCNSDIPGYTYWVTDANNAIAYRGAVTGGGTAQVLAVCNYVAGQWQAH